MEEIARLESDLVATNTLNKKLEFLKQQLQQRDSIIEKLKSLVEEKNSKIEELKLELRQCCQSLSNAYNTNKHIIIKYMSGLQTFYP